MLPISCSCSFHKFHKLAETQKCVLNLEEAREDFERTVIYGKSCGI